MEHREVAEREQRLALSAPKQNAIINEEDEAQINMKI